MSLCQCCALLCVTFTEKVQTEGSNVRNNTAPHSARTECPNLSTFMLSIRQNSCHFLVELFRNTLLARVPCSFLLISRSGTILYTRKYSDFEFDYFHPAVYM